MNTVIYVVTMESDDMNAVNIGYATSRENAKKMVALASTTDGFENYEYAIHKASLDYIEINDEAIYVNEAKSNADKFPNADKFLSQGYFQYGEHYFKPNGKIDPVRGATLANINLRSHTELRMWDKYFATAPHGGEPAMWYEHDSFYAAMNDCDDDIFLCDNGKQYIPCNHELMEFIGYR